MKSTTFLLATLLSTGTTLAQLSPDTPHSLLERTVSNHTFDARSGILTPLSDASLDKRDWFSANIGLMMERSSMPAAPMQMERRSSRTTRDVGRRDVELGMSEGGELVWPDAMGEGDQSHLDKRAKKGKKSKKGKKGKKGGLGKKYFQSKTTITAKLAGIKLALNIPKFLAAITWYTGHDLENPFCAQGSKWTPDDNSMIAAVTEKWGKNRPACGSFLQLKAAGSPKSIVVRVVDLCGGCAPGINHVDLSQAAFKALYALNVGIVRDIEVVTLKSAPSTTPGSWSSALTKLYGPQTL